MLATFQAVRLAHEPVARPFAAVDANCAIQQPSDEPITPPFKLADGCGSNNCAVEQPDTPALPQTPEDCTGPSCATPMPPALKVASPCDGGNCAVDEPISSEPTFRPVALKLAGDHSGGCSGSGC